MARHLSPNPFPPTAQAGFFPGSGRPAEPAAGPFGPADDPAPLSLRGLREACGVSQQEMARRLSIQQAAISKLERRGDAHVGTLRKYVVALGGRLTLGVHFPEAPFQPLRLEMEPPRPNPYPAPPEPSWRH